MYLFWMRPAQYRKASTDGCFHETTVCTFDAGEDGERGTKQERAVPNGETYVVREEARTAYRFGSFAGDGSSRSTSSTGGSGG
jgi:hypothetical protein